jgi:hypothetical protein
MEGEALINFLRTVFQDSIYPIAVDLAVSGAQVKQETSMTAASRSAASTAIKGKLSRFSAAGPAALHKTLPFAQHLRLSCI